MSSNRLFACPRCGAPIEWQPPSGNFSACAQHGAVISIGSDGIIDAFDTHARAAHNPFLAEYAAIRSAEGRGSDNPNYYINLPDLHRSDPFYREARLRGDGMEWLLREFRANPPAGRVLDAAAGNCWLSAKVAQHGFDVVALDISNDLLDGLGAGRHAIAAGLEFHRVRASFETMPFRSGSFDVVIYNGALHYTDNTELVLREALRVVSEGGRIIVIDTPFYRHRSSGEQMIAERRIRGRPRYLVRNTFLEVVRDLGLDARIDERHEGFLKRIIRCNTERRIGRETARMPRIVLSKIQPVRLPQAQ